MSFVDRQTGNLMRDARARAGLTLRAAAAGAGTSHATIAAYESGRKSPTLPTLVRILASYGFAADLVFSRRIRERDGVARGAELEDALGLAESFPARVSGPLDFPRFGKPGGR